MSVVCLVLDEVASTLNTPFSGPLTSTLSIPELGGAFRSCDERSLGCWSSERRVSKDGDLRIRFCPTIQSLAVMLLLVLDFRHWRCACISCSSRGLPDDQHPIPWILCLSFPRHTSALPVTGTGWLASFLTSRRWAGSRAYYIISHQPRSPTLLYPRHLAFRISHFAFRA